MLQSSWDLGSDWQFDLMGRYVDTLLTTTTPPIPIMCHGYTAGGGRAEKFGSGCGGRNLTRGYYSEFTR
jgi:hypothetical protein